MLPEKNPNQSIRLLIVASRKKVDRSTVNHSIVLERVLFYIVTLLRTGSFTLPII